MTDDTPTVEIDERPGMLAVMEGTREQRWPHTMDAVVWADKWLEITKDKTREDFNDRDWMISWFANAIMAGFDTANMRNAESALAERQRAADDARDARRYRWLRDEYTWEAPPPGYDWETGESLDAAIDRAMSAQGDA
jgi:hypothetical protein